MLFTEFLDNEIALYRKYIYEINEITFNRNNLKTYRFEMHVVSLCNLFHYLLEGHRQGDREKQRQKSLPFAGSPPRRPQQPGLAHTEAGNLTLHLGHLHGRPGPTHWDNPFRCLPGTSNTTWQFVSSILFSFAWIWICNHDGTKEERLNSSLSKVCL